MQYCKNAREAFFFTFYLISQLKNLTINEIIWALKASSLSQQVGLSISNTRYIHLCPISRLLLKSENLPSSYFGSIQGVSVVLSKSIIHVQVFHVYWVGRFHFYLYKEIPVIKFTLIKDIGYRQKNRKQKR